MSYLKWFISSRRRGEVDAGSMFCRQPSGTLNIRAVSFNSNLDILCCEVGCSALSDGTADDYCII